MNLDSELYGVNPIPFLSVRKFFGETLPRIGWSKDDEDDVVLDAGCGPGGTTVHYILPLMPKLKRLYAFDVLSDMIELAQKRNFHPKVRYSVANIEDW
ncbi:jhamt [Trichonephila clavata]|uniref:Jhamt n=1 Tax=Trichonephila clavata TaxID=2740835 RepID=A0A8X6M629_TRICU|nr:jhamt [Trichonephila clavata]